MVARLPQPVHGGEVKIGLVIPIGQFEAQLGLPGQGGALLDLEAVAGEMLRGQGDGLVQSV